MKYQSLYKWEKHNVLQFIQQNYCKDEFILGTGYVNSEFTVSRIFKDVEGGKYMYYGFDTRIISSHLDNLVKDGKLSVRYVSKTMEPSRWHIQSGRANNFGSKTVAIFKLK